MKKVTRMGLVLVLMASLLFGYNVNASAAENKSDDGLEVTIVTDKNEYSAADEIKVEISVKNTNDYAVEDVTVEALLPEGLTLKDGSSLTKTVDIEAGATEVLTVIATGSQNSSDEGNVGNSDNTEDSTNTEDSANNGESTNNGESVNNGESTNIGSVDEEEDIDDMDVPMADSTAKEEQEDIENIDVPKAGDNTNVTVWVALVVVAMAAVVFLSKSKKVKKACALLLSAALIMNVIPEVGTEAHAAATTAKEISVNKEIKVAENTYNVAAKVKYEVTVKDNFTVQFDTNGGSEVAPVVVEEGSVITAPVSPDKDGYSFDGWYLDNETFEQKFDFTSPVNDNVTLYAKWVEIGTASGSYSGVDVYNITALTIDKATGKATATVCAPENCGLLVRFIEEDVYFSQDYPTNKTYINNGDTYASHVVEAGSDNADISALINGTLPENYVAEAILFDGEGNPLCDPFTTIENTTRYQAFMNKTINDFEEDDVVLNFDSAEDMNFGVLADDVKVVNADAVIYDEEANMYMLVLPSEEIAAGDKVYVTDGVNEYLFKVADVVVEDDLCTVTPASADDEEFGYNLNDFYKYLKVDMERSGDIVTGEPEGRGRFGGASTYADIDIEGSIGVPLTLKMIDEEEDGLEIKGSITGKFVCEIEVIYDVVLFGKDYFKCDFKFTKELSNELTVKLKAGEDHEEYLEKKKVEKELELGKVTIPFGVVGLNAFAEVNVMLEWEVTAGFEMSGTTKTSQGFTYNTKDGKQKINEKESDWSINCKGTAEIKFGPKPSIGVEFLDDVVEISLEGFIGAVVEAEAVAPMAQSGDEIHCCNLCVNGSIKLAISANLKMEYNVWDIIEGTPIDFELVNKEWDLFDFYVSVSNPVDSMFGGHMKAGEGDCPNKKYSVRVYVYDADGSRYVTNVKLDENGRVVGTATTGNAIYVSDGSYMATAVINGKEYSKRVIVSGGAKYVELHEVEEADVPDSYISGGVLDAASRTPVKNAKVTIYENNRYVGSATTDANGKYKIAVDQGTYRVSISAEGYRTASQFVTVGYGEDKYLESVLMATYNPDSIMGGIYGCINDAVTGRAVSGVKIEILKGWSTSMDSAGEVVATNYTDSYGEYSNRKWTQYGVDFGLTAGNYTIVISKEGYIPTTFNITVEGGMDLEFNSTITEIGSENVYRIVLTWGQSPSDLDSHLNAIYNGSREHVYYSYKVGYASDLDVDDTTSYGPETVTIPDITVYDGNIMYSVHDYTNRSSSGSMAISLSGAIVKVYKGGNLLETFYAPAAEGGTVWNVFYIDENGNVVPVNSFEYQSSPESVVGRVN